MRPFTESLVLHTPLSSRNKNHIRVIRQRSGEIRHHSLEARINGHRINSEDRIQVRIDRLPPGQFDSGNNTLLRIILGEKLPGRKFVTIQPDQDAEVLRFDLRL